MSKIPSGSPPLSQPPSPSSGADAGPANQVLRPPVAAKDPVAFVLLGATGDLAARKLLPALFALWKGRFMPERFTILGAAFEEMDDDAFRTLARKAISQFARMQPGSEGEWREFAQLLHYQHVDFGSAKDFTALAERVAALEKSLGLTGNRLFYFAVAPSFFATAVEQLSAAGLLHREDEAQPKARVVVEKPFGTDLDSAKALNRTIQKFLSERQIYRIDHYLGKDSVQNIFAFRFGNAIFEPLLNNDLVKQVQITVAETVGMEGQRGRFYDKTGALRDVMQNHVLQLLTYMTIDAPGGLRAENIRNEKLRILRNLTPIAGDDVARLAVRGQYTAGTVDGTAVKGYREEIGVAPDSTTEAYVALKVGIDTWRWAGVPFLLRTGKRLPTRATEVAVHFKDPPMRRPKAVVEFDGCAVDAAHVNVLAFRIQPDEGISISFMTKRPGFGFGTRPVKLDFDYERSFRMGMPEAYEHLLLDAVKGFSLLFMSAEEIEAQWAFATPVLEAWADGRGGAVQTYAAGSWGPAEADRLVTDSHAGWRRPGDPTEDGGDPGADGGAPAATT